MFFFFSKKNFAASFSKFHTNLQIIDNGRDAFFPAGLAYTKTDENNILFVEFKKESNRSYGWASDAKKIKDVTDNEKEYSYKYGFHVILNENEAKVSVYENCIEKCCFTCGSVK